VTRGRKNTYFVGFRPVLSRASPYYGKKGGERGEKKRNRPSKTEHDFIFLQKKGAISQLRKRRSLYGRS